MMHSPASARTLVTTRLIRAQILLIVAERFDDKTLAICDYLTRMIGEATFSIELWQYGLFPVTAPNGARSHVFLLEQILPPPSIRAQIEAEREAAKGKKWARDPKRIEFMHELQNYLSAKQLPLQRAPGQSYSGNISVDGQEIMFQVSRGNPHPWLEIPDTLAERQTTTSLLLRTLHADHPSANAVAPRQ